ncbi:MAG TPA: hydroxymethylglutaryl-CoA lyase [Bacteroidetes bacterium]|mgnify:CR=1 FL=1|nr:hydroxymethylglutaryl-CoA lyase [Bacteroidota bacterium]
MQESIHIVECPRDAMQGLKAFIPTKEKISYLNSLLEVGFNTLDFGSFVSPSAIPQMADTALLLPELNLEKTGTKLLAIVANVRGAREASMFEEISFLGFPFSISETFQKRNTNSTIDQSLHTVEQAWNICEQNRKQLVIYLSMGFGNPYGDEWNSEIVLNWTARLVDMGIKIISLADTVGVANPKDISSLFSSLIPAFPQIEFGAHFHTKPNAWKEKIDAAYMNGCRRFDGALKGYGGCPMADDKLTGNMPTENLVNFFRSKNFDLNLDEAQLGIALGEADQLFSKYESH